MAVGWCGAHLLCFMMSIPGQAGNVLYELRIISQKNENNSQKFCKYGKEL